MKIDKSRGLAFTIDNGRIKFYKGLYSKKSCIALVADKEVYLSSPLCISSSESLEDVARRRIWEETGIYFPD